MTTPRPRTPISPARRRAGAILLIALLGYAASLLANLLFPVPLTRANDLFYDTFYRTRPVRNMQDSDVMLVVADDLSLQMIREKMKKGWPWPREFWGDIAQYIDHAGARAIVFDIIFTEPSVYNDSTGDDDAFADTIKSLKTPVIFGDPAGANSQWQFFAPPVPHPLFGAVNIGDDRMFRTYRPVINRRPSLALAAALAAGIRPKPPFNEPFLLHYYGPYKTPAGNRTFRYVSASNVLAAQITPDPAAARAVGITPGLFKNKIVVLGGLAIGTYDLKSSPLSEEYPGPEVQATAIQNLLTADRVVPVSRAYLWMVPLLCALAVSAGVVFPRTAIAKLIAPVLTLTLLLAAGIYLFHGPGGSILWLPPMQSLIALAAATLTAFAWTYFAEDRQRRFMLKALSKVVSPAVAEQLSREPQRLALGTTRADLTILFTDLADFTTISEGMNVEQLGTMLNRYLGDMSDEVLRQDGTLDKYIGDAVMCFWNAPLTQKDHALKACATALAMVAREKALQPELQAMGAKKIFTRVGINTSSVAVGFVGSSHLFNYTVLGDGVNLASRVEGANKLYGTQILITENTAALVASAFVLRKVDVLRVKGKREPMALYELLAPAATPDAARLGALAKAYELAFAAYQKQQWDKAEKLLLELFQAFGEDGPSKALLGRIKMFRQTPPDSRDAPWDGVFDSTEK